MTGHKIKKRKALRYNEYYGQQETLDELYKQSNEVHCHHKVPKKLGGNDKFDNLIIVHKEIHKLIHSNNVKLIVQNAIDWTTKSKQRFNQLRKQANLELIDFN